MSTVLKRFLKRRFRKALFLFVVLLLMPMLRPYLKGFEIISPQHFWKSTSQSLKARPQNFREAKLVAKKIFEDMPLTFYCGCQFNKEQEIDLKTCAYKVQEDNRRAKRLEWEHIMPASHLSQQRACAKKPLCFDEKGHSYKGRRCCQQIDPVFNQMEADLHNLVPEIGELNALRSNYRYGILPHIPNGQMGECHFKIDDETRRVEVDESLHGIIARAYLYMAEEYGLSLSPGQEKLFWIWNKQHPPEAWEQEWDRRVARYQGNHNSFITDYETRIRNRIKKQEES